MRSSFRFRFVSVVVAGALLALFGVGNAVALAPPVAQTATGPTLVSDQPDYTPGSTVTLSGTGWQPGEAVHLYVNDDQARTWDRSSDLTAADDGSISDTFTLPDWFVATYRATATGATSGTVTMTFTDGNIKLHVNPSTLNSQLSFATTSYATSTDCTGASTSGQVAPEGTISSAKATSARLHAPASVVAGATTYDFKDWTVTGATSAAIPDSSDRCVTGFDSGSGDVTANYTARSTTIGTTTTVVGRSNPSTYGDAVTFTATVTGTTNPTSGSVTFKDGATKLCDVPLSGANTAGCQSSTLSAGAHTVTATYNPATGYGTSSGSATQTVSKRPVTGSFTANDKVYDGDTTATMASASLTNTVTGDDVRLDGTPTFSDANVGTGKTVTLNGATLAGAAAGNYTLATTAALTTTASITRYALTASFTAADKRYDGTTEATITGASVTGVRQGDTVTVSVDGKAAFGSKSVGQARTVTAPVSSFGLSGASAGNYSISDVSPTTASITPLHLTGSFTADNKPYDGTTAATVSGRSLPGAVGQDDVSLSGGTATFADQSAGTGKTVTLTGATLAGSDAANYVLDGVATTTADITPLSVTASFTAASKIYDATAAATVLTRSVDGVLGDDEVLLTGGSATFADKNAGTGKTVTLSGARLTGTGAGNYRLSSVATTTADITARQLTVAFSAADKTYDGTATASVVSAAPANALDGDKVGVDATNATATFAGSTVGEWTVTATGFALTGTDAGNYTIGSVLPTTASITAKTLTASFTAQDKVYDGDRTATIASLALDGIVGTDEVSLPQATATFGSKDAGDGRTVTLSPGALGGDDAGNYTLDPATVTTTASITAKPITGWFTAADKTYDGDTSATATGRFLRSVVTGDEVSLEGGTATFGTKTAATGKTVTLDGATLAGGDAHDYNLTGVDTATADITPKTVTASFAAKDKVYDGDRTATITSLALDGIVGTDDVGLPQATATFGSKDAGDGRTVTLSPGALGGNDAGNYRLDPATVTTTASITAKPITGWFTAAGKVYDATAGATVTGAYLDDVVAGDAVSLVGGTASFADPNAGTGKTVTLAGARLDGGDAGNYALTSVRTAAADITPAPLTITADPQTMILGAPLPLFTGQASGLVGGEKVKLAFSTKATSTSPVGRYDIVPDIDPSSASVAANYTVTRVNGSLSIVYGRSGFLQPVNDTAHQVGAVSIFNAGQTIPLKFQLKNAAGQVVQATSLPKVLAPASLGPVSGAVNDTVPTVAASTGSTFAWDGSQYQYNWKTTKSMAGSYYQVGALLDDGTVQTVIIGLR